MTMMTWYTVRALTRETVNVSITGPIEADTAPRLLREIAGAPRVHVTVASVGGDARGGLLIARALRAMPSSSASVQLALSAAAIATCGARHVRIATAGMMMLHNPQLVVTRDARIDGRDLHRATEDLDALTTEMIELVAWRTKRPPSEIRELLDRETWLDARESVAAGLADEIAPAEPLAVAAYFDPALLRRYAIPPRFRERLAAINRTPQPRPASGRLNVFDVLRDRARRRVAAGGSR
jgi:ATP-dependent protease ClpP protease subunit